MEEFNNKTYFTLKEAAKLFGYSPDYLGFLVRKRKIKGKRTYNIRWQITKKELLTYCKGRKKKIKKLHLFNKKLTLKQASRISGYSPDYIGQLLRTGKLKGKRIKTQVSWLVKKQNIENYRDGREERQSETRKPLRFSFIKIRRKKLILIGRRLFASTFVLIYFISGIAPTEFLLASIGAFFIEEPKTINLYSQLAEGDWQNPQNSQGPPDLSPDKNIDSFSESNSAVYQTGPLNLVLKDFDAQEDISNYLFNSAQIKLSFAIGEKEIDLSVIEEPEQETTTSTEEQISFWNKIKQFFNSLLTSIRSIVFKALSIAKAEEEQVQEPQEPEQPDESQELEEIEENPSAEEEGQSVIGEDEESPLGQDTWLDEIIEESEEDEQPPEEIEEEPSSDDESIEGETEEVEEEEPTEQESEEGESPAEETPAEEQVEEGEGVQEDEPTEEELAEEESQEEEIPTETELLPIDQTTTTETEATTTEEIDETQEPEETEETEQALPESDPDILPNLDAKIIIYWSLDNENWQILDTISSYPLSNHLNNGYFTYNTPFLTDWQDIANLQIKFEGAIGGQTNIISYLDSVWITTEYEEQVEEKTEEDPSPDDEGQAPPTEEEQPTDEGGGGGGGDEESPLDQDTWLDEIIEESEEDEQPPEEIEEEPPEESEETEEEEPEEEPEEDLEEEPEEEDLEEESEEEPEEQPEEEEEPEEEKPTKKKLKLKIKDKDLIFSFQKKDFTSNEEPFFLISTPDLTIEELLNTDKAEEILEEEEELPEVEPMATSTIATSTEEMATTTQEIEEEIEEIEEEEEEEVVEEESEEEIIVTTTTEPIIEQATTTEATSTEEESFEETQDEQPPEETEEEPIEEDVEEEPPVEETPPEELEEEQQQQQQQQEEETLEEESEEVEEPEEPEEQLEEESENLTLLEKIKIFFENIILVLKQGIQKIVSIIIKIVRQNISSVKAQAANNLKLTIIQPNGKESSLTPQITTTYINGKEVFEIKLQKPKTGLQPGLYKLQIELETPEAVFISEQEFTWGVLAINVNKSIYVPTEQAYIQMAVLNEWGHTLCDANLELRIKHLQSGAQVRLSTLHSTIKKSGECGPNNVVDVPDYYAYYNVEKTGTYEMTLKNLDTGYEITDSFEAQNSVPFDVERIGPTRIWPWAPYQMALNIKANQDFEGQIIETVPQGFDVQIQDTNYKIIDTNEAEKLIIWDVILTQGDLLEISYSFDAPDISPYLFLLGPLSFQGNSIQNIENRGEQAFEIGPLAISTLATTTVLLESELLTTTTNATGSEVLEAPSEQNEAPLTMKQWSNEAMFSEARKWQLASDAATLNQHSFIFENDDATNVNSNSNMESANATATDIKKGQRFIARFQLDNTGDPSTTTFKLQYDKQDEQWIDIDYGGAPNINTGASSSDWNAATVDSSANNVGRESSIAIGTDGNPVISYYDFTDKKLMFVKCGNPSCTSGNSTTTVDSLSSWYTSIVIDSSGKPMISYYDYVAANKNLMFARCTSGECTQKDDWSTTTVAEQGDVGKYSSMAIGTDGFPVISYYDGTLFRLSFARCTSGECTQKDDWSTTTVAASGWFTSIAIGADGKPVIAYSHNGNQSLMFARCTSGECIQKDDWSTTTVDSLNSPGGEYTSIAIGTDGLPVISYYDNNENDLNVAKCTTGDCIQGSDWSISTVDSVGDVGTNTSIAIGTDGLPVISYRDVTNRSLKIAKCRDSACSNASTTAPFSNILITINGGSGASFASVRISIAIGTDGWPVISYYDDDNDDLKVAKMRPLVEIQPAWGLSGTSSTPLITNEAGSCTGGTDWTDGQWYEATTTSNAIPLDTNECTELAFVLDTVEATASTTYRLRLVKEDGTPLDVYTEYPALKIVKETENTLRYSKEAIKTSASSCGGTTEYGCTQITYDSDNIGSTPSLAIGTDGFPVIAHRRDATPDTLMVTKCNSADCTSATTTEITYNSDDIGIDSSIAIGTDGFPVITHQNSTNNTLMVTKCSSADCTSVVTTTEIRYDSDDVGNLSSIAIGTDGLPVIVHEGRTGTWSLLITKCSSADCTSATTTEIIYEDSGTGNGASIAIGTDGFPVIAHNNLISPYDLLVTKCNSADCTSATTTEIRYDDSDSIGTFISIAIGIDGYPVIASNYGISPYDLLIVHCTSIDCTSATTTRIIYDGGHGYAPSLAIGTDGFPVIVSTISLLNNALFITKCGSVDCTSITTTTRITYDNDNYFDLGRGSPIAIGVDGNLVISYYNATVQSLMVIKQFGLPKTAISYFNKYIKTDGQIKLTRNQASTATSTAGAMWLEASPAIEDGLLYKLDKAGYIAVATDDDSFDNVTSTAGTSTSTPMFVFADKHSTNSNPLYVKWQGQSTLGASAKNIILQVYKFSVFEWLDGGEESPISGYSCLGGSPSCNAERCIPEGCNPVSCSASSCQPLNNTSVDSDDCINETPLGACSCCFTGDTMITMADGSYKNIKEIEQGDKVLSFDEENNTLVTDTVEQAYAHTEKLSYLIVNDTIEVTFNHPVYSPSFPFDWGPMGELKEGDQLMGENGELFTIYSIRKSEDEVVTYNLDVDRHDNFFASGMLAHNKYAGDCTSSGVGCIGGPGTCDYTCDGGYYNCDGISSNGCENTTACADYVSATTPGWVTATFNTTCTANNDCTLEYLITTDLEDFFYPEYKFNDSTGTTSADYWTFWRIYQEEVTGSLSPPTLKTDLWQLDTEFTLNQRAYIFENDDGNDVNSNSDMSAANTITTDLKKGQRFVARFQIDNTSLVPVTTTYKLQYDKQDDQWIDIDYGGAPNINSGASSSDWNTVTVDSTGNVGQYSSIAIGTDGNPVISYTETIAGDDNLLFAKCSNTECTSVSTTIIDEVGDVGSYTSIAIGTDGLPVISYFDDSNGNLNVAKCTSGECIQKSNWSTSTVHSSSTAIVGQYTSIAIGTDGNPVIAYYNDTNDDLMFIKCGNSSCTSGNSTGTVDSTGNVGQYTSIAIGADGLPVISYYDVTNYGLKILKCGNSSCDSGNTITLIQSGQAGGGACDSGNATCGVLDESDCSFCGCMWNEPGGPCILEIEGNECDQHATEGACDICDFCIWTSTVGYTVGKHSSIAIGADGNPVVAYTYSYNDDIDVDLNFLKCGNSACSSGNTTTTIDSLGDVGEYTSIAIGTDGLPMIAYQSSSTKALKIAKCRDSSCSSASTAAPYSNITMTIDDSGGATYFGAYTSIAIGWDGWPVISYYDGDNLDLKVAKMRPLVEIQPAWGLSGDSGDALNAIAAGDCYAGTSWTNGQWYEATTTATIGLGANECTELAFVLDTVEATASTTYRLRLVKEDGTTLDSYSEYPALKIVKESSYTQRYSKEAIKTSASSCDVSDWECSTVDSTGNVGSHTSIAIGTDGNPVVSYYDATNGNLNFTKCGNSSCTSGNTTTIIDEGDDVGQYVSIAIGTDGNPVISYYNITSYNLNFAKCTTGDCTDSSDWTTTTIDGLKIGSRGTSIAIGTNGKPMISYGYCSAYSASCDDYDLLFARCTTDNCTQKSDWATTTVDSTASVGYPNSIAIGTDGNPVVSYSDFTNDNLNFAKCTTGDCTDSSDWTTFTIDSQGTVGSWNSIAIGTDGNPVISYYDYIGPSDAKLRVAKCGNPSCSSGNTTSTVDSPAANVGRWTSIAIGVDGNPIISYQDSTNGSLKIAECNDTSCSGLDELITTIDDLTAIFSAQGISIAIGTDGNPVVSYFDDDNDNLKIAKQLGLPKTAISYFNRYIKTDGQVKLTRNGWPVVRATQGPNNPSVAVNDESWGTLAWTNPTSVYTDNGINASRKFLTGVGGVTYYLKATGFGFSIPDGAIIKGILVEVERNRASAAAVVDSRVRIVKGGTIGSIDKASGSTWPITEAYQTYGGADDLWGKSWEYSDINSSDFGMVISAEANALLISDTYGYIDHIRITVGYTAGGALYLESSPAIEDGLLYKADKVGYTAMATDDTSYDNVTSTGGTSTSTPMFVFTDKHSSSTRPIYTQWLGQSTLGADSKNIVLQVFRFGNSSNTTGWVTTTVNTTCTANTDCTLEYSTTTDLTDFYYPEYKFNDSTGTTSADYWTFWRIYQKEATGAETPSTLKTDFWGIQDEPFSAGFIKQYHIRWRNDDGAE